MYPNFVVLKVVSNINKKYEGLSTKMLNFSINAEVLT